MAPFLLFALVLASQLMAAFNAPLPLPPPSYGNHVTILSIDGGGIRGIIPAAVLEHLDKALKKKDPTASLAHYFDVISGTSTGGIMTAMLAAPRSPRSNIPLFTPSEVIQFYKNYGPSIFDKGLLPSCPRYDGKFLRDIARQILKETRLNQTITNVVIPTFDATTINPVIFSNYQLRTETYMNAKLSDICLGTSAAPTYLPAHKFTNDGVKFNLVDGAMAANNPAMVAATEAVRHTPGKKDILMLSLGTGTIKPKNMLTGVIFDVLCASGWLVQNKDVLSEAIYSTDMIYYYLASVFPGLKAENYLRIQEYDLNPANEAMDNANKRNMDQLEIIGKALLQQKAKKMDVNNFIPYELNYTNAQALDRLAEKLYAERQLRLRRKYREIEGSPIIEKSLLDGSEQLNIFE